MERQKNYLGFLAATTHALLKNYSNDRLLHEGHKSMDLFLEDIRNAMNQTGNEFRGLGKTGELLIGTIKDGKIFFLTDLRFEQNRKKDSRMTHQPMLKALSGETGAMIGLDYRGEKTIAAYKPLSNHSFGIVAKIDLYEIRLPFFVAFFYAVILSFGLWLLSLRLAIKNSRDILNITEIREQKYHAYIAHAPIGISVFNQKGIFQEVNDTASDIFGAERSQLLGSSLAGLFLPESQCANDFTKDITKIFFPDKKFINLKNEEFHILINFVRITKNHYLCFFTDITARREMELAVIESEEMFRSLFESANDAIIMADHKGLVVLWNSRAEKIFGYDVDTAIGQKLENLIIPYKDQESHKINYEKFVETGQGKLLGKTFEITGITRAQQFISVEMTLASVNIQRNRHAIAVIRDLTEKKHLEAQLMQTSKMATLGEMAAGIAHELNQPLTVIRMGIQLTEKSMKKGKLDDNFLENQIETINRNVDRMIRIISNLKLFGRKFSNDGSLYNINTPIERSLELASAQVKNHSINLVLNLAEDLPNIKGDENSLEHVIINFIMNSIDAFDESDYPEEKNIFIDTCLSEDKTNITLKYRNNGPPIPVAIIDHIFEPFSTSKPPGKGTGLGMSIAYGVVQSHNGTIEAKNTDFGPLFIIKIPIFKNQKLNE
jgi:PAS domain S-box-containing protein